jgi:hypothetical protein
VFDGGGVGGDPEASRLVAGSVGRHTASSPVASGAWCRGAPSQWRVQLRVSDQWIGISGPFGFRVEAGGSSSPVGIGRFVRGRCWRDRRVGLHRAVGGRLGRSADRRGERGSGGDEYDSRVDVVS